MKVRKRYLFYALAFTSAVIAALTAGVDQITTELLNDPWALSLACFITGVLVSLFLSLILSISIGSKSIGSKYLDPSFKKIRFLKKEELKYQILAGFGNAIQTIGYFFLLKEFMDPSVVLPFTQIVILYLVIIESITEKDIPTLIEVQSSLIVTFGAILGSISLSGNINTSALFIVFAIINPGWVLFSINQRKLKLLKINGSPNDSLNIRLWNVIFAFTFTFLIMLLYDILTGNNTILAGIAAARNYLFLLLILASGTFFSFVFYIRALGIGKASVTQAVRSSIIIFTIPVSIILSIYGYSTFASDPVLLLIKTIGIMLMILGIISFALTLTKAYVFIKVAPGVSYYDVMNKIWNIHGVSRVTAVAGPYDLIIKIRTRTLVKGYEKIIRKLENISGIEDFKWQSVLKEWENI